MKYIFIFVNRDIIVRPQWLSRSNESSTDFKARVPLNSSNNNFPYTPVIAFINKRSGGQIGEKIYRELLRRLNPRQIFLLENNDTITHALEIYSSLPNIRICVFGGDGTVGWILGRLAEAYPSGNNPPVSICPLGTGNDLSRVLFWGEQYDPKQLFQTLLKIPLAQTVALDRWQVQLEELDASALVSSTRLYCETGLPIDQIFKTLFNDPKFARETNRACYENYQKLPNTRFINYMSFGLDAAVALEFHDQRTRDPSKFSSPLKNKLMYLNESCKYLNDFARANIWNLSSYIRLICDGQDLTDALNKCHTLIVLNIPGYAAGTNPWGNSSSESSIDFFGSFSNTETCFDRQDFGDRKIEVVGLNTAKMAAIHVGFSGYRIAQCHQLRIELSCSMTAQMDGEPFYLPSSVAININHAGQVLVAKN
jgi:diacylglycerol kinase (ATP)